MISRLFNKGYGRFLTLLVLLNLKPQQWLQCALGMEAQLQKGMKTWVGNGENEMEEGNFVLLYSFNNNPFHLLF